MAYAAISFDRLFAGGEPVHAARRLVAFLDGYGPDQALRTALPTTMAQRARAMHYLLRRSHETGKEPWATMYVQGHGQHWAETADYVARNEQAWRAAIDQ